MSKGNFYYLSKNNLLYFFYSLFIIVLPWQTRWIFFDPKIGGEVWEYGRLGIYFSMILLFIVAILFSLKINLKPYFSKDKLFYFSILYFLIINIFSPIPQVSYYYLILVLLAILFFYIFQNIPKIFSLKIFLFSGLIQSIYALYQFLSQRVLANKWLGLASHAPENLGDSVVEFSNQRILRAYGSLPHPNILGGFLLVVILVALYLWLKFYKENKIEKHKIEINKEKIFYFSFIISSISLASFAMLATFSRSAILVLLFSLVILLILYLQKKDWLSTIIIAKFILFFILIFTIFNIWMPGAWNSRIQSEGRLETKSTEERVNSFGQFYWQDTRDILFGQGLGMNSFVSHENNIEKEIYETQPIHNVFLLAIAEIGIFGLLLLLIYSIRLWPLLKKSDNYFKVLLLALLIVSLFDHYIWTTWIGWVLLFFALANLQK